MKSNNNSLISETSSKFNEETLFNPIITLCCKETFCLNCYNINEDKCPKCNSNKKGYVRNDSVSELIKKLLNIIDKINNFQ